MCSLSLYLTYVSPYVYVYIYMYIYVYIYMYICIYMYIYVYTLVYISTYTPFYVILSRVALVENSGTSNVLHLVSTGLFTSSWDCCCMENGPFVEELPIKIVILTIAMLVYQMVTSPTSYQPKAVYQRVSLPLKLLFSIATDVNQISFNQIAVNL